MGDRSLNILAFLVLVISSAAEEELLQKSFSHHLGRSQKTRRNVMAADQKYSQEENSKASNDSEIGESDTGEHSTAKVMGGSLASSNDAGGGEKPPKEDKPKAQEEEQKPEGKDQKSHATSAVGSDVL